MRGSNVWLAGIATSEQSMAARFEGGSRGTTQRGDRRIEANYRPDANITFHTDTGER